ncbi:hypothetical protein [Terribacillus sp. DMT04]|uniref:hypothetical protein n=1 Tax=Terribacillus sp. DMT04 TaxID=2850441 RepID=UPI001C2C2E3B|nr:hypothetical protein [Terribacillus sp. DMT04]QXE03193.1 hypothetical protein KS242_08500 [Terribacillus sp. DMT04]
MKKKPVIITSVLILAILGVGGTAAYATSVHHHKEGLSTAKKNLNKENEDLNNLLKTVESFEDDNGYLSELLPLIYHCLLCVTPS